MATAQKHTHMRFNIYDNVYHAFFVVSSVALRSFTGSSAVKSSGIDTVVANPLENAMIRVRAEIASGSPSVSTLAWKLQESADDVDGNYADAKDNTGTVIGATLDV